MALFIGTRDLLWPGVRRLRDKAEAEGLRVLTPREAAEESDLIVILAPDQHQRKLYAEEIEPQLAPGDTLVFGHGFNIRFGYITPPEGVDVFMVAPKGPGHLVRRTYTEGGGVPALIAVHQDATGQAKELALSYAEALELARQGAPALRAQQATLAASTARSMPPARPARRRPTASSTSRSTATCSTS